MKLNPYTSMAAAAAIFGLVQAQAAVVTIGNETTWTTTSFEVPTLPVMAIGTDDPVELPPGDIISLFVDTTGNGTDASIYINWSGSSNTYQYFLSGTVPGRYVTTEQAAIDDFEARVNGASGTGSTLSATATDFNLGAGVAVGKAGVTVAVPEPTAPTLALVASLGLVVRRRRN